MAAPDNALDRKVLAALQEDASRSLDQFAKDLGASKTPVWNRIRKLKEAGVIRKEVGGELKEHRFVRADTHASAEAANDFAVIKARQIIDEQGERIFRD